MSGLVDVAVIGAGPAGLAAATVAAEAGLSVVVVDAGPQPGGQYWRHPAEAVADRPPSDPVYRSWRDRFDRSGADYRPATQVWFVQARPDGFGLRLTGTADGAARPAEPTVTARRLVLCPGGHDRHLPVPGWDLPGVMAAGGVQALLKGSGVRAGARVVVAGTGPFLLPVAAGLAEAGAQVVQVCEANPVTGWLGQLRGVVRSPGKALDAGVYAGILLRHRVPYRTRTAVTAVHGADAVEAVTVSSLDRRGRPQPGGRRLEVDLVALGWGFTPALELVLAVGAGTRVDRDGSLVAVVDAGQRTTVSGVYAAGEVTGVSGAELAVAEGALAGLTAAADAGRAPGPERTRRALARTVRRHRAFAGALHGAHPIPTGWSDWLTEDTVVCRCEEVTRGRIRAAVEDLGAQDARTVKLLTRTGMGWCQGRMCGFATALLCGAPDTPDRLRPLATRPLCAPIALGDLAAVEAAED